MEQKLRRDRNIGSNLNPFVKSTTFHRKNFLLCYNVAVVTLVAPLTLNMKMEN